EATFNPVLLRSVLARLRIVTPRLFETVAANTIPLFVLDPLQVREIYGEAGLEMGKPGQKPPGKILGIIYQPQSYCRVVAQIPPPMAQKNSHAARLRRLIEIVET